MSSRICALQHVSVGQSSKLHPMLESRAIEMCYILVVKISDIYQPYLYARESSCIRYLPFFNLTENLAEKFPSEFRISPSEFGEMVENSQHRKSDGRI